MSSHAPPDQATPPGLTPAEVERLAWLAEECGEVVQAVGKVLRHGFASPSPVLTRLGSNRETLQRELGDVLAAISMMSDAGDLDDAVIQAAAAMKRMRVRHYLHHQREPAAPAGGAA